MEGVLIIVAVFGLIGVVLLAVMTLMDGGEDDYDDYY